MKKIAFLDLATNIGWASGPPDGDPLFGTKTLPSTGNDIGRFARAFDEWLNDFITVEQPALLAFEAPILTSGKTHFATARKLTGLAWHTEFVCGRREVHYFEANLSSMKKDFAGHGRADKDDMIAVARRYGWNVRTEHEADACGGWAFTVKQKAPAFAARFAAGPMGARPLASLPA
jgi:Holliday junction resolvasome RuvABC endonuclease subunit